MSKRFAIYRRIDKTIVEGGFFSRQAAQDYLLANYAENVDEYCVAVQP